MRFFAHFMFAANLLIATSQVHATAYNQPAVDTDPARKLYDAGHPTQAVNLPDGSIILVGDFNHYAGVRVDGIVKLSPSGEVDAGFLPRFSIGGDPTRHAMASSAALVGQHLYVSGAFDTVGSVHKPNVARFAFPGLALDLEWSRGGGVVNPPILVTNSAGMLAYSVVANRSPYGIAFVRVDSEVSGSLIWESFGWNYVYAISALPNGDIAVLGFKMQVGDVVGVISAVDGRVRHVVSMPNLAWRRNMSMQTTDDGDILVAGDFHILENGPISGLVRIDGATGTIDPTWSFTSDEPDAAFGAVLSTVDGGAIVTGSFSRLNGIEVPRGMARIRADGTIDSGWGSAFASTASRFMHAIDDERFLVVDEPRSGEASTIRAVRLNTGSQDTSGFATSVLSADPVINYMRRERGLIFVGGDFERAGTHGSVGIAKLSTQLDVDANFTARYNGVFSEQPAVRSFAVGGGFVHANTLHYEWTPGIQPESPLGTNEVLLSSDSGVGVPLDPAQLVAAGGHQVNAVFNPTDQSFYVVTPAQNVPIHKNLLRYDPSTGIVDVTWSQVALYQHDIGNLRAAVIANDFYYAGGFSVAGHGVIWRAPANVPGGPQVGWNPGFLPDVYALAVDYDRNWIYVGGRDTGFGAIARINSITGLVDPSWTPLAGIDVAASAIDLAPDGWLYLGGWFDKLACNPTKSINVIRFSVSGTLDKTWHVDVDNQSGSVRPVNSVLAAPDGRVLIGGRFQKINSVDHAGFAVVAGETDGLFSDEFNDSMCIP